VARIVAEAVNGVFNAMDTPPNAAVGPHCERLNDEGYSSLGQTLSAAQATEIVDYFLARPCFSGHVAGAGDGVARMVGGGAENFHYGAYSPTDIVQAPHLIELANHPQILEIAHRYLGCMPTLYSLNAWWSFSGHGKASLSQEFHRDMDGYRFCTLFVFLTDVGAKSGAHLFIRQSHRYELVDALVQRVAVAVAQKIGRTVTAAELYEPMSGYGHDPLYGEIFAG
jgi:hypothetical protein